MFDMNARKPAPKTSSDPRLQQIYAQRAMGASTPPGAMPMSSGGAFSMKKFSVPGGRSEIAAMTKKPMMTGRAQPFAGYNPTRPAPSDQTSRLRPV